MSQMSSDFIWYPFTQMKTADPPICIERAEGVWLYAEDGRRYLDAISSWWVNLHGHAHPVIAARVAEQARRLEQVIFAGFTHSPAQELARSLMGVLPTSFAKVFFSDDGSTSVEVALKMAIQFWHNRGEFHRRKVIAFDHAYHGDTFGAMAVGERGPFNAPFASYLFDVARIPTPGADDEVCLDRFCSLLDRGDVAAFIFEPLVQGAAGMRMYNERMLDRMLEAAQQRGVVCIADEVMTGFGRTGRFFASDFLTRKPDVICLSKGITGGFLPLGVTACSAAIYEAFHSDEMSQTFFHGHSYTANPLACAAALASLDLLREESCWDRIRSISRCHEAYVQTLLRDGRVRQARCRGTILAVELEVGQDSSYFHGIRNTLYRFYIEQGILLRPLGNVVYVLPPYCIAEEELDQIYAVISQSLSYLHTP